MFQIAAGQEVSTISSRSRPAIAERKVAKFSELKDDDKNVTIEVAVVSYIPKIQTVRGEDVRLPMAGSRTVLGKARENAGISPTGVTLRI